MSRFEAWTLHLSSLLVGGTGLVYAWMRYLAEPDDPFAVVNHPWQPTVQHLHILVAPLLVFAAGFIWREHVWKHWRRGVRGRRRSGLSMMLTLVPMILSGYLIQTTIGETWRGIWVGVHLVTSGLWVLAYAGHAVAPLLARPGSRRAADRSPSRPSRATERPPIPDAGGTPMQHSTLHRSTPLALLPLLLPAVLLVAACSGGGGAPGPAPAEDAPEPTATDGAEAAGSVVVYSGRNESLIRPVLERFTSATGVEVQVRYGETAELAATLMEEGDVSPADLLISQDAAALGALAGEGMFRPLPAEITARVPQHFADPDRLWVGLSGRARTVVYNTERMSEDDLPRDLEAVTDPRYRGRFGVAPLNGSFQAHMAVYRALNGAEALDALLAGMAANEPGIYPKNSAIVEAVLAGEVDFGLVNHYYLWRALDESPGAPGANSHMPSGDASGFVNIAGAGVLSDNPAAVELVRYLLSEDAQTYFARETFEYPLVDGVEPAVELTPLAELDTPDIDFREVSEALEPTLRAIQESGLLQ